MNAKNQSGTSTGGSDSTALVLGSQHLREEDALWAHPPGVPRIREWVNRASSNLRLPDWLRGPQAAAHSLPPARHWVTVRLVSELDDGAGAPGRGLGRGS